MNIINRLRILRLIIVVAIATTIIACRSSKSSKGGAFSDRQWVENVSHPYSINHGLQGKHISLWSSHGRYYDQKKGMWKWQRPLLFCTTEDLFTQTIVTPYLIPMLERAGANVFTPRERSWQRNEIIVDNDNSRGPNYSEINGKYSWKDAGGNGFAYHYGSYVDNENPFMAGTARQINTSKKKFSYVSYTPNIPKEGDYPVYVSYITLKKSIPDAHYTVWHQGKPTDFVVNQQRGGSTWVYLGTFHFDAGCSDANCVVLSNESSSNGVVTTDAVRFGAGMGNIERGGSTSGLPRALEAARYYAQWAGAPYKIYGNKQSNDDYSEDINVRSMMTNWLISEKRVPFELTLAIHSDAGFQRDYRSITGSLSICTTDAKYGTLGDGSSRKQSTDFANALLEGIRNDITITYGNWNIRAMWDRNYSETRLPKVPSAIIETMSHQNFPDMVMGQDPNFRFTMARSIYKTILRDISKRHRKSYVVMPLAPTDISVELTDDYQALLRWKSKTDPLEPSAKPSGYVVYTSVASRGYDNGVKIGSTSCKIKIEPGVVYSFRVTAVNSGGESFPTEEVSIVHNQGARKTILVVNGFHRLSAPYVVETDSTQGFDINIDPGVSYGLTAGISGEQLCFDKTRIGIEGPTGLGYSGTELQGKFIMGNTFNYIRAHVEAIAQSKEYNVCSTCSHSVEDKTVDIMKYHAIDLILGLERYDRHQLVFYKTFTQSMQNALRDYASTGGRIMASGSYLGSDMLAPTEQSFLNSILKVAYGGTKRGNVVPDIKGMGTSFYFYSQLNEDHYAATSPEVLLPVQGAFSTLTYSDGTSAGVAYSSGNYRCFTMGFPFECITSAQKRASIMQGIMKFLTN